MELRESHHLLLCCFSSAVALKQAYWHLTLPVFIGAFYPPDPEPQFHNQPTYRFPSKRNTKIKRKEVTKAPNHCLVLSSRCFFFLWCVRMRLFQRRFMHARVVAIGGKGSIWQVKQWEKGRTINNYTNNDKEGRAFDNVPAGSKGRVIFTWSNWSSEENPKQKGSKW